MKNSRTKQLTAALLALILVMGIASACGGKKADGDEGDSGDGDSGSTPVTTTTPPLMDDIADTDEEPEDLIDWDSIDKLQIGTPYIFSTINFLYGYDRGFQKFNEEFGNKAEQLDATGVGGSEFTAREDLLTAISSGDVWNVQATTPTKFPIMQCWHRPFTKIDKFINWDDPFWVKEFHDKNFRWRGNYYAISSPGQVAKYFLSYNPRDFAQASLPTPREYYEKGEWCFQTIIDYGMTFKPEGKAVMNGWPIEDGTLWDATWYNHDQMDDSLTPNFDTLATRDFFNFLEQMRDNDYIQHGGYTATDPSPLMNLFVTFFIADPEINQKFKDGELELVPFATKDPGRAPEYRLQAWIFMIPRGAKDVQASVLLAQYLCQGMDDSVDDGMKEIGGDKEAYLRSIMPKAPSIDVYQFPGVSSPFGQNFTYYYRTSTAAQYMSEWTAKVAGEIEVYNMTYLDGIVYVGGDDDEDE